MSEEVLNSLAQQVTALKRQLDLYVKAATAAADGHYLDAEQLLRKSSNVSRALKRALRDADTSVGAVELESIIFERSNEARRQLRTNYELEMQQAQLAWSGEWPSYIVQGVVRVSVDVIRGDSTVDGRALGTIEPGRVVPIVRNRVSELLDREFDPVEFGRLLADCYAAEVAQQGTAFGTFVGIQAVYSRLRGYFAHASDKQYNEAKFAVDLFRLREAELPDAPAGRRLLQLSPAQDASGGLYIPTRSGGNYIASLRFTDQKAQ